MKAFGYTTIFLVAAVGCMEQQPVKVSDQNSPKEVTTMKPDNTAVNERDRADSFKTPIDQGESQSDIDKTANIRKRIMEEKMSVNAQNVKIITTDGSVSLRGPVASAEEKERIHEIAVDVAGKDRVDDQLEIQAEK